MLWSLIKILAFVALVAGITYGAVLLTEVEGSLTVQFGGIEATLSTLQVVVLLALFVLACWLLFKLIGLAVATFKLLNGDETAISRYFARNRERRGFEALADGIVALAAGEGRLAMVKAERAERLLGRPELTTLLTAQAAEQVGDTKVAERAYKKLLENERTRFVGVRGLMKQKLAQGDTETALRLAEKAFALKPDHDEVQDTLLQLQAKNHDWSAARQTLAAKLRHGKLPRDVHRRRDAVLALSEAKEVFDSDASIEARERAIEANRLSPDLVPAAVMAARSYIADGNGKYAARVIKAAWQHQPHPDLAEAYAAIEPDETPQERLKRFAPLLRINPDHPETRMLKAELLIAAEDFPEARRALGDLPETDPTARSLALMAAIERGQGADDQVVRGWLAKALTAPRGPQWICDNCGQVHADWQAVCDGCGSFDTLTWKRAAEPELKMPAGADMLPLLVGRTAPGEAPVPVEAEVVDVTDSKTDAPGATEEAK